MKILFLLLTNLFLGSIMTLQAQDKMPQAISYQAVARDAQGKVVAQKPIGIQVEILKGSTTGTVVFSETHTPTSSQTGTVNLLIGQGTRKTGAFSSIDWGADTYYLQLSMDLNGGNNYQKVSTTQMLPVPYALYAAKAGEVMNGGSGGAVSNAPKFTFVTESGTWNDNLYPILSGEYESNENNISLEFMLLYLDGIDQELTVSIEGLSLSNKEDKPMGKSSPAGRLFNLYYENVLAGNYTLVVRDKNNNVIKEYPFVFKISK